MSMTKFEEFRAQFVKAAAETGNHNDVLTANLVFQKTCEYLSGETFIQATSGSLESLETIPKLITNRADAYANITTDGLYGFLDSCQVPRDLRTDCAMEVARILAGNSDDASKFYTRGRASAKAIPMQQVYDAQTIAMVNGQAAAALESFGEYTDRVTTDSRLAVALTVLRSHRSLVDRVLARRPTEDPVTLIKIPSPEVYNLADSYNAVAATRYNNRQPMITLYRDPSTVNTQPQQIIPLKANDTGAPAYLYADGIVNAGVKVNLFDMTLQSNTYGDSAFNWTDLVSDGGAVGAVLLQVTDGTTTELYSVNTQYYRTAQFTTQTNVNDSGDRMANLRFQTSFTAGATTSSGATSTIFSAANFTSVDVNLDVQFNANLNIKTSYVDGAGSILPSISTTLAGGVPSVTTTEYNKLVWTIVAWTPYLFFSEENMRKTNTGVRMNYKEMEFLVPVGKNFVVDYSIMGQALNDDVMSVTANMVGLGNSARAVNIITNTLTAVNGAIAYENSLPSYDWYTSISQSYAAGTLCLPYTYIGSLNVSTAAVMREAERLSDLHAYVTNRLTGLIADAHNKSMYLENFEPGEKPRWKVITSGPIAEVLFGVKQYWATLQDELPAAEGCDCSLRLPNGVRLDVIKSNFIQFANTILMVPVREAKPDDVTSFGVSLDCGTYVGQYTNIASQSANKRIVVNSREIVFPTNPMGFVITVTGMQTELGILIDGPGIE